MRKIIGLVLVVLGAFGFSLFGHRVSTKNILAVSWQKSFCVTHKNKKECRSLDKKDFAWENFTIHGLWPQPRSKQNCSNRYERLDSDIWKILKKKMPGVASGLAKHEWRKHGSCYGKSEEEYFKDAMKLLDEVNDSKIKDFFVKNQGKVITKEQLNMVLKESFGNVARKVQMVCKRGFVTELRFSLDGNVKKSSLKKLLSFGKPLRGGCQRGKIASF